MNQNELPYRGKPPHVNTETSIAAAESIEPVAGTMRAQVLDCIRAREEFTLGLGCGPLGCTDDELEVLLSMRHQTASARRRELQLQGFIVDSGWTRTTRSGREAIVWVLA